MNLGQVCYQVLFKLLLEISKNSNTTDVITAPDDLMGGDIYKSEDDCLTALQMWAQPPPGNFVYCPAAFDTVLCWPVTPAGKTARQHCPDTYGLDPSKFAQRSCFTDGKWQTKSSGMSDKPSYVGWTNYSDCYTPTAKALHDHYRRNRTEDERKAINQIVYTTRILKIVGLFLSMITLVISLIIFFYFRNLKCDRTRIHRNLFIAILLEISLLLVDYLHQQVNMVTPGLFQPSVFQKVPMCQVMRALLEYFKTTKFMWMLIEGLYLNNMVTVSVFSRHLNYTLYNIVGWGVALPFTITLTICMIYEYKRKCWDVHYYTRWIWTVEGPRVIILVMNTIFYCNIIRILISKLRNSYTNEEQQVRKAIKAALVLLPLLGITNFAVMIEPSREVVPFALWSYVSHFLQSFQGFFVGVVYCFLNGEVRLTIAKWWWRRKERRIRGSERRKLSRSQSFFISLTDIYQNRCRSSNALAAIPLVETTPVKETNGVVMASPIDITTIELNNVHEGRQSSSIPAKDMEIMSTPYSDEKV